MNKKQKTVFWIGSIAYAITAILLTIFLRLHGYEIMGLVPILLNFAIFMAFGGITVVAALRFRDDVLTL